MRHRLIPGARQRRNAELFHSIATLLEAGLSPRASLAQPGVRRLLTGREREAVDRVLSQGRGLAEAFAEAGFGAAIVARLGASETAGRPAAGLRALATEASRDVEALHRLLSRLAYPLFVLHAAALVRGIQSGLLTGEPRRGLTAALTMALAFDVPLLTVAWIARSALRGGACAKAALSMPGVRKLLLDTMRLPFLRALADLHDSGVPLDRAVVAAAQPAPATFREPLDTVAGAVRRGEPLVPALEATGLFDETTLTILEPAETTGTLSEGLARAAVLTEQRLDTELSVASRIPGAICYAAAAGVVLWMGLQAYRIPLPSGF